MKDHYTCTASVRGNAKKGCHKTIKASYRDVKTLKKAGWQHDGNFKRDRWKCPVCKPKKESKLQHAQGKRLFKLQHNRGMSDAVAGHSPSDIRPRTAYHKGYVEGLSLITQVGREPARNQIREVGKSLVMSKFIVVMEQAGEGCDYGIGCGTQVHFVNGKDVAEAFEHFKKASYLETYDNGVENPSYVVDGEGALASVTIYEITSNDRGWTYRNWIDEVVDKYAATQEAEGTRRDEAEFARLKKKLKK